MHLTLIFMSRKKNFDIICMFDEIKSNVKEGIYLLFSETGYIVRNIMTIISIGIQITCHMLYLCIIKRGRKSNEVQNVIPKQHMRNQTRILVLKYLFL